MPALNIKEVKRQISEGQVFMQRKPGGNVLRLGTVVEPIRFVEAGTLRGPMCPPRKPLTCSIEIWQEAARSVARLGSVMDEFMAKLERWEIASASFDLLSSQLGNVAEYIERRRLWPRYALVFTLIMATVALWT